MFVQDLKQDFYNQLRGKRILIVVNYDIDAICASKILQVLFKYDHVLYSVMPIMGISGLKRAFDEHRSDVKFVLLINCGASVDVVDMLQPDKDVIFYICDSHRPLDVCNIYSDRQVRILGDVSLEENIPTFESIFNDSDDEDDELSDDEDEAIASSGDENESATPDAAATTKRPLTHLEKHERFVLKQRAKHAWEQERDRIMFEYTQYAYYARSTALMIFELAWKLSKDSMDLLWLAMVGITEQLVLGKIESSTYTLEIQSIQSHVSRLTNKTNDQGNVNATKIFFESDLHMALYRHWNVLDSMKNSMYSACKLKLWTLRGEKRLAELLVEMGLPLIHARQNFNAMDLELRQEFFGMMEKLSEKYDLPDIVYGSFTLSYGYHHRYAAADFVYAMLAILESMRPDKTPEDCFLQTLDSLTRNHRNVLDEGICSAKKMLQAISKQVHSSLEAHQIHSTGSFFYYVLTEENAYFSYPYGLTMLAKFMLHAHVSVTRNRHAPDLPLIACCPVDVNSGLLLLVGIPPVREDSTKNFFGRAFEQAAVKSNTKILQDFFETTLLQIRQNDLSRFLDALTVLMTLN